MSYRPADTNVDPNEVTVASEQSQFNLSSSQLTDQILYDVVLFAENSVGQSPPSNAIVYIRDRSETGVFINADKLVSFLSQIFIIN